MPNAGRRFLGETMSNAEAGPSYSEAIALLQKALVLCDEAGVGKAATPHLDLALNLLLAEYQASRALAPTRD
jgi:hypothetical protein